MFARVSTIQGDPGNVEQGIETYRQALSQFRQIDGNKGAFLLVDRDSGKVIGTTLWDSEEAMSSSRERANELRKDATDQTGGTIESVDEYEVAVWETAA